MSWLLTILVFALFVFLNAFDDQDVEDEVEDIVEEVDEEIIEEIAVPAVVVVKTFEEEEAEAQAALKELDESIEFAQKMTDASPNAPLAAWHVQNARDWCVGAKDKLKSSRNVQSFEEARVGLFHSELAIDIVLEYRSAMLALTPKFAETPVAINAVVETITTAPVESSTLMLGVNSAVGAPSPVVDTLPTTDANVTPVAAPLPAYTEAVALETTAAAVEETAGSDLEVENDYEPEYCQSEDSDIAGALPEWRKLGLLAARAAAIIDARIKDKFIGFTDANRYLSLAVDYSKAAEDARFWEDVPGNVEDGLFWARLSIEAATEFLTGNDYVVKFPSQQWDTENSDDEAEDVRDAITDMALSLVDARLSIGRAHGAPDTANYHFDLALEQLELACRQYPKDWDQAQETAEQGFFYAGLAAEAANLYITERDELYNGADSTIDEDFEQPDPDYVSDDDETIDDARNQWRELVLRMALLEAFHTVKCPLFSDRQSHMRAAEAFVVKMNDSTDWEEIPDIASGGNIFVGIAYADAVKSLSH